MSNISRAADTFYAFRFLKLLITPWKDTGAYEQGIVDENGKVLKKGSQLKTTAEKSQYTIFHRLVFNIKRLINKLPFGKTRLGSWITALYLIKEETGLSEDEINDIMATLELDNIPTDQLKESTWFINDSVLMSGVYTLKNDSISPKTGEVVGKKGSQVLVQEELDPLGEMSGISMYKVTHIGTNQEVIVNSWELKR